ncbi:spermatogenesis-associated protein 5-like protein 1 [Anopheles darlingi]|uniref:spermatogenesis-associated protein 5-like protein 1 n=1 Tax=Anopheles darlingi TaxID=43151 RepID=UPI00210028E9|nr:spermatogenesis-associated protein 5-like protein 1 [Anopheles darlingi]
MEESVRVCLEPKPYLEPAFTAPQSCVLWLNETAHRKRALSAGTRVIGRLKNGRRFLWCLETSVDRNSSHREGYFAAEAIEPPETDDHDPDGERTLVEIVPVCEKIDDFERVTFDLWLDLSRLRLELMLEKDSLKQLLRTLLVRSFFCCGSRINLSCVRDRNLGLSGTFVREAVGTSRYGFLGVGTVIDIGDIIYTPAEASGKRRKSLGGLESIREQLAAAIANRSSVLISGPSGTGKYSLVKSLAVEQNYPLFEVRGLHFVRSLPGETEAELRRTFLRLRHFEELIETDLPILLLVKDIDMICPKVGQKKGVDNANIARISSQFISLLDQYAISSKNIIIIGTTSSIEDLDHRLRRPGRLAKEITLGIPSKEQRIDILRAFETNAGGCSCFTAEQLEDLASRTTGYVGAELELLYHNVAREMDSKRCSFEEALTEAQKKHRPSSLKNAIGFTGCSDAATLSLDSFGGMEELKSLLRLCIVEQLKHPERFHRLGIHPLKGILLYGPPGCAKTTLAKCLAAESGMTFLSLSAAEIYSPYVGEAERLISTVFNEARMNAPAAVFLDEIDSLVGNRGTAGMAGTASAVNMGVLSTLLLEMDGIGQAQQSASALSADANRVVVLAATNRPDMVDDALLRPGRLTKLIHIPAPDEGTRLSILRKIAEGIPLAPDVDLTLVATRTERFSGADLNNLCSQAALAAATTNLEATEVTMGNFEEAFKDIRPSLTQEQIDWFYNFEANKQR